MLALIANPASGRGAGKKTLPAVRAALRDHLSFEPILTAAHGDEARAVAHALDRGATTIAVLGGDGTWSNTARALLDAGAGRDVRFAPIAAGTGNDLVKTMRLPARDPSEIARLIAGGASRFVDAGTVNGRWFVNNVGFGFDAAVLERTQQPSMLRGNAVYLSAALSMLFGYRGFPARVNGDAHDEILLFVAANGAHFGGAFHIAPSASIDDGVHDLIMVKDVSPLRRLPLFGAVVRGAHLGHERVSSWKSATTRLSFPSPPSYDADGELVRANDSEIEITCVPAALRVIA